MKMELYFTHDFDKESVRAELASQNMTSVAFRYGPEGEEHYAEMFSDISKAMTAAGFKSGDVIAAPNATSETEALTEMLGGQTPAEYLADCRWAKPAKWTDAKAVRYLSCLFYQSCEHEGWEDSKAKKYIMSAKSALATRFSDRELEKRKGHVWEVNVD